MLSHLASGYLVPRLFIVLEYPTLAGGEMSLLSVLGGVQAAGYEVSAAAPPRGRLADALRHQGVAIHPLELHDTSGLRWPLEQSRARLAQLLRAAQPDLVHANSLAMGRLLGPVVAELGTPSLAHLRDIVRLSRQAIADLNCHRRLLAVSRATRDYHVAAGLAANKTVVVPNGVDLQRFQPRAPTGTIHRQLGLPPTARLIGTIGQISLRKGVDVMLDAFRAIVGQSSEDIHLLVVGSRFSEKEESRDLERQLRCAAEVGRLKGRVHFLGYRDDVASLLPELTLLVHTARQEPLGRVLLEAAAAGRAIVATDVGGTAEIFPPGLAAARLVPPDDPARLAHEIRTLLDDAPACRQLAAAARRRAVDAFGVDRAATALIDQYRQTL